ncbi:SDR family NAD(P)-dependent oxidoreductase [Rhodococcus sp. IEGM 1401]|uniref:SDR family NAD(P)-dependent oxidoreductase n=1 Tax=unclassified Rhodococcus (in: high G+C Gram-positive bacteria) TaxID=192944 RepID=UPI000B9C16C9|nr:MULTISPECIES: SDR family oxidoreductase [unclassified Rhodococcus (in: high G+C Gram-positive bacteria)]MCZ4561967.1 SDR family NAD(P)-dependent oxidoreductase [Rhodococcus sp. IEGM 1401]MDI9922741.1 SDR family oxidoreductase [Rhodococcus sp. IEGM 1372]MDV7991071.1 SDR family oxidoreductase [Rhodococcus sp. IEGM 1374]MDV8034514.1 SDR family oxidoreductase [Rhodococcus sp. IEGM 1414]OZE43553.1 short-chain dehydrogenase [Rhodococcus sp. 05-2254-6]
MTSLDGARILVFGASGGLGGPIVEQLAKAGARLTLSGRSIESDHHTVNADLTLPDSARSVVAEAVEHHGGLDGIVIAAGVVAFGPVTEVDDDTVDELLLLNYLAPLRVLREALTTVDQGGFVLNISAVVADKPMPNMGAYSASKAAVSALLKSVRTEARKSKIRIVDVRPPHTETGLATRPIAGQAPKLPQGLTPDAVAARIVAAITDDETDVGADQFS